MRQRTYHQSGLRILVLATLLTGPAARADDSFFAVGTGGLVFQKTDGVAMQREDLFLSPDEVRVRYEMRNAGTAPVSGHVAFPLPAVYAGDNHYQASNIIPDDATPGFLHFTLLVDGQPKQTSMRVWATLAGRDVTTLLAQNGLGIRTLKLRPQIDPASLPPGALARLKAAGALSDEGGDLVGQCRPTSPSSGTRATRPASPWSNIATPPSWAAPTDPGPPPPSWNLRHPILPARRGPRGKHRPVAPVETGRPGCDDLAVVPVLRPPHREELARPDRHPRRHAASRPPDDQVAICPTSLHFHPDGPGRLVATATDWTADSDIDAMFVSPHPIKQAIP